MTAAEGSNEYHKSLSMYRSKGTHVAAMNQWFHEKLQPMMLSPVREMQDDEKLRVLAIASGPGIPDAEMLEVLLTFSRPIEYTVVDPNEASMQIFKDTVPKAHHFRDITFNFYIQTIQLFLDTQACRGPYHLIHIIDSLCYIDDVLEMVIEKCVNLLTPEGIFFTYDPGANQGACKVYNNNQERRVGPTRQMYLAENMERLLNERSIPYTRDAYNVFVDVVSPDGVMISGQSEEADYLLDLFTEVKDVRKTDPSLIQPLLDDIKAEMVTVDGKHLLKDWICAFAMRKPKQ